MLDINQAIANNVDPTGNMAGMPEWSETLGREIAEQEGIALADAHWEVVHYLRGYYMQCGMPRSGTSLLRCLEDHFSARGGKKYLYELFPHGPVSQAGRIAGLPLPPYSRDASFGSVE